MSIPMLLTALLALRSAGVARADDAESLEYPVKAAMLFNFAQFVEWPKQAFGQADAPLVIGVVGDANPFGTSLDQVIGGKKVAGRSLVVRYKVTAAEASACQIVFIPQSADAAAAAIVSKLGKLPVLTVGESDGFLKTGGMIRFFTEAGKIRFEVAPEAAEDASLKISSKLLKLAKIYKR